MYKKTNNYIKELVETKKIPGASYAFVSKETTSQYVYGKKQIIPYEEFLEEGTLYDMASLTKVICTTTIILQLVEKGKIEIDQPLNKYLPDFKDPRVTIRELLTHTSDINPYIPNRDKLNQKELKQALLALTSGSNRGEAVVYTDTGTILLGFLIESFYQKPVQQVFKEEILNSLHMNDSDFSFEDTTLIAPTEVTKTRGLIKGTVHDPKAFVLGKHCGSAGLFSTVNDTLKFVYMVLNKGMYDEKRLLEEETVLNLLLSYTQKNSKPRSLGWDLISYQGRHILYHTGYTGTFIIIDILAEEAFVFLSNRVHPVDNKEEYLLIRDELIKIYLTERQEREKML